MNEAEVDLRPFIAAVLEKKWWILALGIIFALIALIFTVLSAKEYTASAMLLLTRSRSVLSLAEQFPTVNEPVDTRSRMDALMAIAGSDVIANQTLQSLSDAIPVEYRSIEDLNKVVSIRDNGDSIAVSASTKDPQLSTEIANTWANQLADTINLAYSGEQPLSKIQDRLNTAEEDYSTAQAALEDFIEGNPKKELETRLDESNQVLATYGSDRAVQIAYYLNRKQAMEELQQQATALKRQLESGNRSTAGNIGDALAVILARMNAILSRTINTSTNSPDSTNNVLPQQNAIINLQIDGNFPQDGTAGFSADIDAIIKLAEEERANAAQRIEDLAQEINHPDPARVETISAAAAEIQDLERQIESARAKENELTSNRDLAWEAYQALAQKEAEIKNTTLTNNQVTLASEAVIPNKPDPRGTVQKTLIAGILGILLGVILAIGLYWWRNFNLADAAE